MVCHARALHLWRFGQPFSESLRSANLIQLEPEHEPIRDWLYVRVTHTMGVKKRIAPAAQAHYRLRATKLRKEKRLNQHNGMQDASMGEALETHEAPTAPPHDPSPPQEPTVQTQQEMSKLAQYLPKLVPENHYGRPMPAQDTPPASPTNDSPPESTRLGTPRPHHSRSGITHNADKNHRRGSPRTCFHSY